MTESALIDLTELRWYLEHAVVQAAALFIKPLKPQRDPVFR